MLVATNTFSGALQVILEGEGPGEAVAQQGF